VKAHRISVVAYSLQRAIRWPLLLLALILHGCASNIELAQEPEEYTLPPSHAAQWEALAKARHEDWFHVLNAGNEALDWRLRAIDSAVGSINLQTFIWKMDKPGKLVRQHLIKAAERGVIVRIMLDDSFTANIDQELLAINHHPNVEIKIYNPYPVRSSQTVMRMLLNAGDFDRLDHRMHNKLMVVDNQVAIIGGRNTAAEYFGYHPKDNFRDMELITAGKIIAELSGAFDNYWNSNFSYPMDKVAREQERSPQVLAANNSTTRWHIEQSPEDRLASWTSLAKEAHAGSAQLFLDRPAETSPAEEAQLPKQLGESLFATLSAAKSDIWAISPYLIPTEELEEVMRNLRKRGVRLRILTNSIRSNNHLAAHSAYSNHLKELVAMGAEVHEVKFDARNRNHYIEAPIDQKWLSLHAKVILIDEALVFVGSPNLDARSLKLNTEMGLLINSPSLNQKLRELIEPDFDPGNAWRVSLDKDDKLTWSSDTEVVHHQPTHSYMRRLEDWFLAHLPIEDEM